MRIAVVSPETSFHRETNLTVRLNRLVVGLVDVGHEVTVICTGWESDHPTRDGRAERPDSADDRSDGAERSSPEPTSEDEQRSGTEEPVERTDGGDRSDEERASRDPGSPDSGHGTDVDRSTPTTDSPGPARQGHNGEPNPATNDDVHPATRGTAPPEDEATDSVTGHVVDGVVYKAITDSIDEYNQFLYKVPIAVRSVKPDAIHAFATPPGTVLAACAGSKLARAPVLAEWYDPTDADGSRMTVSQAATRPDRLIVPSRLAHRQLRELGADKDAIRVIPDAVRMDEIDQVPPADGFEIVYARRLDDAANLETLFLGLAELRDQEWSVTVIGDGPARGDYERQASDLRISGRVTFAGACDRRERIAIYRDSHVFAQTARQCPFATELLWALACGCVGIVEYHAESSAHELVEGRDRGFRTTNPQEMADAILDAGELDRMTIDDSFHTFDEPTVVKRYVDCYETVERRYGLW
jgi:hypothetical protein